MSDSASVIWRDNVTEGVPASGIHKPAKNAIRDWGARVEAGLSASGSGVGWKDTKAILDADLAHDADTIYWVGADTTPANNGIYVKSGASGSGSWVRKADLPMQLINMTVTGGTANAITATAPVSFPTVPFAALFTLQPTATNTGAVTVTVNGGSAVAVTDYNGDPLTADYFAADKRIMLLWNGTDFQAATDLSAEYWAGLAAASAAALSGANLVVYADEATADAATIPAVTTYIVTADTAPYLRFWKNVASDPGIGDRFQSADGQWWEGLPVPPAFIDPAAETTQAANVTFTGADLNRAHVATPGLGATVAITLPAASAQVAGTLVFIRVKHDAAGYCQLKATAGQPTSLIDQFATDDFWMWAGEAVLLQAASDKWHIVGKRVRPMAASFVATGADIAIAGATDVTGIALSAGYGAGLYLPAGLAFDGANIVAPRRGHYRLECEAVLGYTTAPTLWWGAWKVAGVSGSLDFTYGIVGNNAVFRAGATKLLTKGQTIVPQFNSTGGTGPLIKRSIGVRITMLETPLW